LILKIDENLIEGALQNFGTNLDDYLHLLIPPIVRLFESNDIKDNEVKIAALKTIDVLSDDLQITEFSSRIIHAIVRTIDSNALDKVSINQFEIIVFILFKIYFT